MSDARSRILSALRKREIEVPPLPEVKGDWIRYPDRVARFTEALASVGGQTRVLAGASGLAMAIAELPVVKDARRVCSLIPEWKGTVALDDVEDPHTLADLDVTIARAQFGVAESGALWFSDEHIRQRAALFVAQHVVFVVAASTLVDNLHDGYARIRFAGRGYGVFVSGPSKTADIEQSLVIGAHGPRSATVFVVES